MQRPVLIVLPLCLWLLLSAQSAPKPLCVIKEFSGEVRVRTSAGDVRVGEVGPLYEGETLVLADGAEVTLITGKDSVDLGGPLELPITSQVLAGNGEKDQTTLVERLASLLPSLRGSADYEGGAVKAPDGTALALVGPRGTVLGGCWRFAPAAVNAPFTLEIVSLDRPNTTCMVSGSGLMTIAGLPGRRFEYIYYADEPENADWSTAIAFERVAPAVAREIYARMQQECQTELDQVLWLAGQSYTYDAWELAQRAASTADGATATLLNSIAGRLAATLYAGTP